MWLTFHKEKWKLQKKRRDERKRLLALEDGEGSAGDHTHSMGGGGLSGMLRQQSRALIELGWQIVQVRAGPVWAHTVNI